MQVKRIEGWLLRKAYNISSNSFKLYINTSLKTLLERIANMRYRELQKQITVTECLKLDQFKSCMLLKELTAPDMAGKSSELYIVL